MNEPEKKKISIPIPWLLTFTVDLWKSENSTNFCKNADLQSDILSSSQFENVSHINGEIIHTK